MNFVEIARIELSKSINSLESIIYCGLLAITFITLIFLSFGFCYKRTSKRNFEIPKRKKYNVVNTKEN